MVKLDSNRKGRVAGGQTGGAGIPQAGQPAESPGAHGQGERPEHGDDLESDVVAHHRVDQNGDQTGQREVEGVEGKAVVPARVPPGESAVGEQLGLHESGHGHVRPGVTAGGGGVGQQQRGMELGQGHHGHAQDGGDVGPHRPRRPSGQPLEQRRPGSQQIRGLCGAYGRDGSQVDRRGHLRRRPAARRPGATPPRPGPSG